MSSVDDVPKLRLHGEADDGDEDVPALADKHEHGPCDVPDVQTYLFDLYNVQ